MSLTIKRAKDNRVVKCILHRIADIPGGVTVSVANLGGSSLFEGTPIGKGKNGAFEVCKTAQIITEADAAAKTYEVAKGHHFKVGDRFDTAKDVITVGTTLGAIVKVGTCAFESSGANKTLKVVPCAIAGSNEDVEQGSNLFVSAWVHAVVRESNAPIVNATIKASIACVSYV